MNWLTKNLGETLGDALEQFLAFFSEGLNILLNEAAKLYGDGIVEKVCGTTTGIALALVTAMVLKNILCIYILETDGDADSDPLQQFVKAAQVIALISMNTFLFNWLIDMSTEAYNSVMGSVSAGEDIIVSIGGFVGKVVTGQFALIGVLFAFLLLFGFIAVAFKTLIRGAELALMKILFPLFSLDLLTTSKERWNAFLTSYLITFFGYIIQILCYRLSISKFAGGMTATFSLEMALSMAWLYLALKAPKWLEKFCYSSGIGHMAGSGMRTASFMLPSVMMRMGR